MDVDRGQPRHRAAASRIGAQGRSIGFARPLLVAEVVIETAEIEPGGQRVRVGRDRLAQRFGGLGGTVQMLGQDHGAVDMDFFRAD